MDRAAGAASLRNDVRTELAAGQPRRIGASAPQARRRMLVGPCLAPQHSYWFVAQARPGSPPVRIPKIVDYEFLRYAGDRSPAIERVGQADRSVGAITGCDASCIVLEHYGLAWDATGLDTGSIDGTIVGQGTNTQLSHRRHPAPHGREREDDIVDGAGSRLLRPENYNRRETARRCPSLGAGETGGAQSELEPVPCAAGKSACATPGRMLDYFS